MGLFDKLKVIGGNQNSQPQAPAQSQKKVLVVEDEKMLADALAIKLTQAGYTVLRAANGEEGLSVVQSQNPDIVLMDIMMPVMDGKTMLHKLREMPQFKTLPVIVLTNAGGVENIKEMQMYYNANDFLIKSNVTPDEIVKRVKKLIG